ncbi:MAG: LLM class flavin-dependent oxidoreductase [Lachnospiraceae bacterium]
MSIRNGIKSQIVRTGFTMQEVVDRLAKEYDWSDSVSRYLRKIAAGGIRYKEVVELADVLDWGVMW